MSKNDSNHPGKAVQIVTAVETREVAEEIAQSLLAEHLAACVQIAGPVSSAYWWKGAIERSEEWIVTVKSTRDRYRTIERQIVSLHTYDTPEIIAVPVIEGSQRYLAWMSSVLAEDRSIS